MRDLFDGGGRWNIQLYKKTNLDYPNCMCHSESFKIYGEGGKLLHTLYI